MTEMNLSSGVGPLASGGASEDALPVDRVLEVPRNRRTGKDLPSDAPTVTSIGVEASLNDPSTTAPSSAHDTGTGREAVLHSEDSQGRPLSTTCADPIQSPNKQLKPRASSLSGSSQAFISQSRSTAGSSRPVSRHASRNSHRRQHTSTSVLSPSASIRRDGAALSQRKKEDLLALHREACRLFQKPESNPEQQLRRSADSWLPSSPAMLAADLTDDGQQTPSSGPGSGPGSHMNSPVLGYHHAAPLPSSLDDESRLLDQRGGNLNSHSSQPTYPSTTEESHFMNTEPLLKQTPVTVIDWTSPSTRRREYEKIDRASRGVRGWWHRVAPKWCHSGDSRTPFFKEGKDGRGNYEGSVRRFRIDIPDEPAASYDSRNEKRQPSQPGVPRRRWSCIGTS